MYDLTSVTSSVPSLLIQEALCVTVLPFCAIRVTVLCYIKVLASSEQVTSSKISC